MSEWKAKRFWKSATVAAVDGGFTVLLDGRNVKTPAKTLLVVPTSALADVIASEWDAQIEQINPLTMPFTRSANAALDKVQSQHSEVAEMIAAYGDSDLLCYRADSPNELVARQIAAWDPLLAWARADLGLDLAPRIGVIHAPQSDESRAIATRLTHAFDAFELTAFHDLVALSGSFVIGLAAVHNTHSSGDLWAFSRIDETWQEEQWGVDDEAVGLANTKARAFDHAMTFLKLIHAPA